MPLPATFHELLRDTVEGFLDDNCSMLGAALAFYTALSLAPMLLIFIGVVGIAYGGDDAAARDKVVAQSAEYVGKEGAQAVEATLSSSKSQTGGVVSTVIGVVSVLFGALGVFFYKVGAEPAPFVLGFVLGPMMEENFRRAMYISRGDPLVFVERPISALLLAMAVVLLVILILPSIRAKREEVFQE